MRKIIVPILFFSACLLVWYQAVALKLVSPFLLPFPQEVFTYLLNAFGDNSLLQAIFVTMQRLVVGYLLAVLLGLPLGCLCSRFRTLSNTAGLLALAAQALPSVCWVPFALLAFGQSEAAMLFVVIMGSVGSITLAAESSFRNVPTALIEVARSMGSRRFHTVIFVLFPAALPQLFSGMKQGWAFAWRSLMAAEIYVTVMSGLGLGQLLHYGRELHAMDQVLGVMFVILSIGLALDRLIFVPIENHLRLQRGIALAT